MAEIRGNLGEWSELLVLGKILVDGGGYSADEKQMPIKEQFNKVLEVIIAGDSNVAELIYQIKENEIYVIKDNIQTQTLSRQSLKEKLQVFLLDLTDGKKSKTFTVHSGLELMDFLSKKKMSAGSSQTTNDLELVIEDPKTGGPTSRSGFSIKSQLGSSATLLNASGATNIIYKIVPNDTSVQNPLPNIEKSSRKKDIQALYDVGYHLEFSGFQSETFARNLSFIDSQMPTNLAKVVLNHYLFSDTNDYAQTVERTFPSDKSDSEQIVFKFKELLGAVSMGLRPAKAWMGNPSKFKGLLVIKSDGELLFYYLVTRLNFEEFLYQNVKIDRPDTRLKFGTIYWENAQPLIKLNFQIRFK